MQSLHVAVDRLKEMCIRDSFPAARLEKIQAAFADFKKEALQRKKAVKTGTASPKEFTDWLYQDVYKRQALQRLMKLTFFRDFSFVGIAAIKCICNREPGHWNANTPTLAESTETG